MDSMDLPSSLDFAMDGAAAATLAVYFQTKTKKENLQVVVVNLVNQALGKGLQGIIDADGASSKQVHTMQHQARQLYRAVLHHMLTTMYPIKEEGEGRHKQKVVPMQAQVALRMPELHLSLVLVALELVCLSWDESHQALTTIPAKLGYENNLLSVWDACHMFKTCASTQNGGIDLSQDLMDHLDLMTSQLEERLVLAAGSNFYELVFTGGGGMYQDGNMHLVSSFIAALGQRAVQQIMKAASALAPAGMQQGVGEAEFASACGELMDCVLMQRLDIMFGVSHIAVGQACCMYGMCKALSLNTSFKTIMAHMVKCFPGLPPQAFASVQPAAEQAIDLRSFYNTVFLPACDSMVRSIAVKLAPRPRLVPNSDLNTTFNNALLASSQFASSVQEPSQMLSGMSGASQLQSWYSGPSEPMDLDAADAIQPQMLGAALRASQDGSDPDVLAGAHEAPAKRSVLQPLSANTTACAMATTDKSKVRQTRLISVATGAISGSDAGEDVENQPLKAREDGLRIKQRSLLSKLSHPSSQPAPVTGALLPTSAPSARTSRMPR